MVADYNLSVIKINKGRHTFVLLTCFPKVMDPNTILGSAMVVSYVQNEVSLTEQAKNFWQR